MRLSLCLCWVVAFLPACASPTRTPSSGGSLARPSPESLRSRAEQLWKAQTDEDWMTTYLFEDSQRRQETDPVAYADWKQKEEPFVVRVFRIAQVDVQQELGWVELDATLSLRKFPSVPPRDVRRWDKWRFTDGDWYPIPPDRADAYPSAPALREPAEEARLLARSNEVWQARRERDWPRLYQLILQREREQMDVNSLANEENRSSYLARKLEWVDVVGNVGRVRVGHEIKVNDPSMQKLPPDTRVTIERWIKDQGEWYLSYAATPR